MGLSPDRLKFDPKKKKKKKKYDNVFENIPVVTVTQAWLSNLGIKGGSTRDNAVVNEITTVHND